MHCHENIFTHVPRIVRKITVSQWILSGQQMVNMHNGEERHRNIRISEVWLLLSKRDFYLLHLRFFVTEQVSTFSFIYWATFLCSHINVENYYDHGNV